MTPTGRQIIMPVLQNMKPGTKEWNAGLDFIYNRKLRDVPDTVAGPLADAIIDRGGWRPDPEQVYDMAMEIMGQDGGNMVMGGRKRLPADVVAEMRFLMQKYGPYGQPMKGFEDRFPRLADVGPPCELSPEAAKVVAYVGGWESWVVVPVLSIPELRVLEKVAESVINNEPSDVMKALQAEWTHARRLDGTLPKKPHALTSGHLLENGDILLTPGEGFKTDEYKTEAEEAEPDPESMPATMFLSETATPDTGKGSMARLGGLVRAVAGKQKDSEAGPGTK